MCRMLRGLCFQESPPHSKKPCRVFKSFKLVFIQLEGASHEDSVCLDDFLALGRITVSWFRADRIPRGRLADDPTSFCERGRHARKTLGDLVRGFEAGRARRAARRSRRPTISQLNKPLSVVSLTLKSHGCVPSDRNKALTVVVLEKDGQAL